MTYPRVLCLGEILFDRLADQIGKSLAEVESWTAYPGGAPANVACGMKKLGTPTGFIGCVGKDAPGNALVQLLEEIGVDIRGVQRHETAPTRQVYVVRSQSGDRSFAGFGEYDTTEFADTHLQASQLPVDLFENADFLVLGTLELAYPETRQAIHQAIELANQNHVKIILDLNMRDVFWPEINDAPALIGELLDHVDFLKLSEEEAEWLFDITAPGAIAYRLNSVEGILVTAGEKGCAYCISDNEGHVPAFPVQVVDTTGAGDSFLAGFIHKLCQHGMKPLADPEVLKCLLLYASAVGALTTMQSGAIAAQPTDAEVKAFLRSQPHINHCWELGIW